MCARFNQKITSTEIQRFFEAAGDVFDELTARINTAPTQSVLAISGVNPRILGEYRWGLIPFWSKDINFGRRTFNARSETIATKPAFRAAFRSRRCLVPVAGFYEWTGPKGSRQPMYICRADGKPMAIAGLWEENETLGVTSCTIATTESNETMSEIHSRMPVVLEEDRWDEWLASDSDDLEGLQSMLVAPPEHVLAFHPVHPRMGNTNFDEAAAIEPYEAAV